MLDIKDPKVAIPIVLIAGLLWSFGPYVVRHIDQPQLVPWQYLFTRGIVIFILLAFLITAYVVNLHLEKKNNEQAAEIYNKWIAQEINTEEGKNASNEIFQELTKSFPSSGYSMIALLNKASIEAKAGNLDISYEK